MFYAELKSSWYQLLISKGKGSMGGVKVGLKTHNEGKWGYGYESGYEGSIGFTDHESKFRF